MTQIIPFGEVERMLANIETVGDAATVRRAAIAVKELARQAGLSLAEQNRAAEHKIRAEWKGGRLLVGMGREQGGAGRFGSGTDAQTANTSPYAATLEEAGITRRDAVRWQRLADFPEERLDQLVTECRQSQQEITTAYVLRAWRREEKNEKAGADDDAAAYEHFERLVESPKRYGTIYADPPWLYGNQGTRGATGDHYTGLTVEQVCAIPVRSVVADNAHLHLWTTNAFLFDARQVLESWGFTYKSVFVWVKPQMGMGNYWRVSHEFCLLGVRGSMPFGSHSEMSWQQWPRGKHSSKPGRMYETIERVSPGPYLEMFARLHRPGWDAWGHLDYSDLFMRRAI